MGFITFNETYYKRRLEAFESKKLTEAEVYEARQLLKVLDDLTDEGYVNLNDRMEADFACLSRLRAILKKEGVEPFVKSPTKPRQSAYFPEQFELSSLLEAFMPEAMAEPVPEAAKEAMPKPVSDRFLRSYSEWLGYEPDTAYVFLLRDAILPYIYFKSANRQHVYPWLISRRFLEGVTGIPYVDDDIRLPIYEALEKGHRDFTPFAAYCREEMLKVLEGLPQLKKILKDLLGTLQEKRIMVVESGYMGTIPMMLKALDDRVTFRMYTTAPFLYETYKDHIYCRKYEDIRKFETFYAAEGLMRYASFSRGQFYVNVSADEDVRKQSLKEISDFINSERTK